MKDRFRKTFRELKPKLQKIGYLALVAFVQLLGINKVFLEWYGAVSIGNYVILCIGEFILLLIAGWLWGLLNRFAQMGHEKGKYYFDTTYTRLTPLAGNSSGR